MRRYDMQQLWMYMLCIAVLFTMGTDFGSMRVSEKVIAMNSQLFQPIYETFADFYIILPPQPKVVSATELIWQQQTNQATIKPEELQINTDQEVSTDLYEVTAYYLNVRENKDVASKILNVVKKGDILEIQERTSNNWLKLSSGGYVHGKYAKLVNEVKIVNSPGELMQLQAPIKPSTLVKSESRLTETQIKEIFEGTSLANHDLEQTILEMEQVYGINAFFTIAVMKLESGHGKSKLAKEKNNLFGLNAIDGDAFNKAYSFKTKEESIEKFGQLISKNYVDKGYTSIEKVASKYCQANSKWSTLVLNIMKRDYEKVIS